MKASKITIVLSAIVVFMNFPIISMIFDSITNQNYYNYSTADGCWTQHLISLPDTHGYPEYKVLNTVKVEGNGEELGKSLRRKYAGADTVVYRVFRPNPFLFWRWGTYIFGDPKYDFPYKSWDEIKARRPKGFVPDGQWQMF